jgi:hypothetical protein
VLLVDHSTRIDSGAGAPICLVGLAMRSNRAEVQAEVECGIMKRSCILSS